MIFIGGSGGVASTFARNRKPRVCLVAGAATAAFKDACSALNQFLIRDPTGGPIPVFDEATWTTAALADPLWNTATWTTATGLARWHPFRMAVARRHRHRGLFDNNRASRADPNARVEFWPQHQEGL